MIYILYPCSPSSHFGAYQQATTMAEARSKIKSSGIRPDLVTLLDDHGGTRLTPAQKPNRR